MVADTYKGWPSTATVVEVVRDTVRTHRDFPTTPFGDDKTWHGLSNTRYELMVVHRVNLLEDQGRVA